MSQPDDLHAVLIDSLDHLQFPLMANALAAFRKVPYLDGMHQAKTSWGIVGENLSGEESAALVECLKGAGTGGVAILQSALAELPPEKAAHAADFGETELAFRDRAGASASLPWDSLRVLAAGGFKTFSSKTIQVKEGPNMAQQALSMGIMMATGIPINIGPKKQTVERKLQSTDIIFFVDIIGGEPLARFRIDPQNFDYSFLKERKQYNVMGNLKIFLGDLVARAPRARQNKGTNILVTNQPLVAMGYDILANMERESRWLLSLPR